MHHNPSQKTQLNTPYRKNSTHLLLKWTESISAPPPQFVLFAQKQGTNPNVYNSLQCTTI